MDLRLTGKHAIVTGASRGIGFAIADALAREGADVVLAARNPLTLEAARQRIAARVSARASARMSTAGDASSPRVLAIAVDTTDDTSVRELIGKTVEQLGSVDILVNSAAQPATPGKSTALFDLLDDDLRNEVETKVLGYLRTARAAAPHMAASGWGRIINVSGLAARQTGSTFGSIRNVAVSAMTKNLADELGTSGINVTAVHPGITVTERTPSMLSAIAEGRGVSPEEAETEIGSAISIGRIVTAEEIAEVVAFLASPLSVSITGDSIGVGGGARGVIHY